MDNGRTVGFCEVTWGSDNTHREPVASEVYLYRVEANDYSESRKMVMLK